MVSSCLCSGGGCWWGAAAGAHPLPEAGRVGDSGDRVPRAGRVTAALHQEFLAAGTPGSCCLEEPAQYSTHGGTAVALGADAQCGWFGVCECCCVLSVWASLPPAQGNCCRVRTLCGRLQWQKIMWRGICASSLCQLSAAPWLASAM